MGDKWLAKTLIISLNTSVQLISIPGNEKFFKFKSSVFVVVILHESEILRNKNSTCFHTCWDLHVELTRAFAHHRWGTFQFISSITSVKYFIPMAESAMSWRFFTIPYWPRIWTIARNSWIQQNIDVACLVLPKPESLVAFCLAWLATMLVLCEHTGS